MRLIAPVPVDASVQTVIAWSAKTNRLAVGTADALVLENVDGTGSVSVPVAGTPQWGEFSPDGKRLVFGTWAPSGCGCFSLRLVNADGSDVEGLSSDASRAAWAPDGTQIAYVDRFDPQTHLGRLVLRSVVSGTERIVARAWRDRPAFSPDGEEIAFAGRECLCVLSLRTLARRSWAVQGVGGPDWTSSDYVLWSPDGRKLAVNTATDFNLGLVVVNLATRRYQVLAGTAWVGAEAVPLAWSPDSRSLLWQWSYQRLRVFASDTVTGRRKRLSRDGRSWSFAQWTATGVTFLAPLGNP